MSDLYGDEILVWSERQAELLRRRAAGEPVNDDEIDWHNVAEEIEDIGRGELHTVESLLTQALIDMLKAEGWPTMRDAPSWRAEGIRIRGDASDRHVSYSKGCDHERRRSRCG
jgi:hypothetical protein